MIPLSYIHTTNDIKYFKIFSMSHFNNNRVSSIYSLLITINQFILSITGQTLCSSINITPQINFNFWAINSCEQHLKYKLSALKCLNQFKSINVLVYHKVRFILKSCDKYIRLWQTNFIGLCPLIVKRKETKFDYTKKNSNIIWMHRQRLYHHRLVSVPEN